MSDNVDTNHQYRLGWALRYPVLWLCSLFFKEMPHHTKRMCVLVSLYSTLASCDERDTEAVTRLMTQIQKEFKLSAEFEALRLPALIRQLIWKTTSTEELNDLKDPDQRVNYLLGHLPSYLRYSSRVEMRRDIEKVLTLSYEATA